MAPFDRCVVGLSYQCRRWASRSDPVHLLLARSVRDTCPIEPMLAFIQPHSHPSAQPLRGFHASRHPDFYRIFHNQGAGALPPQTRFPTAHLPFPVHQEQGRAGAEMSGLVRQMAGLPRHLALAPCMRISPHTAPMQKFRSLGRTSAWAWQPRRVARRGRIEWLCRVAARPMISGVREHGSGHHGTGSGAAFDCALVSSGIVLHACVRFGVCGFSEVGLRGGASGSWSSA